MAFPMYFGEGVQEGRKERQLYNASAIFIIFSVPAFPLGWTDAKIFFFGYVCCKAFA